MSLITVREAAAEDREALIALLLDAYGQYQHDMSDEGWQAYKADIIKSVDEGNPLARIVAELNGELVGSILLFDSSASAYGLPELGIVEPVMRLLATAPKARGQGVASALIAECMKRASKLGASSLHLHTSDMMQSAIRLYERLGFVRDREKEMYKGDILVKSYKYTIKEDSVYGGLA